MNLFKARRGTLALVSVASLVAVLIGSGERYLHAQELHVFKEHEEWGETVAFSPDGKTLAAGDLRGTVQLFDIQTGKLKRQFIPFDAIPYNIPNAKNPNNKHKDKITYLQYSADGKTLLVQIGVFSPHVFLYDVYSGKLRQGISAKIDFVSFIRCNPIKVQPSLHMPDIAVGSTMTNYRIANIPKGRAGMGGGGGGGFGGGTCRDVALSPNEEYLAIGNNDIGKNSIMVWDTQGTLLLKLLGHESGVAGIAFLTNGEDKAFKKPALLSLDCGGKLQFWNAKGKKLREFDLKSYFNTDKTKAPINSMAISPDRTILAIGGKRGGVIHWDLEKNEVKQIFKDTNGLISSVAFSSDGKKFAWARHSGIFLWDLKTNKLLDHIKEGTPGTIRQISFSPDGKSIAATGYDSSRKDKDFDQQRTLVLWNLQKQ